MQKEQAIKKLSSEIEELRDKNGYIQAGAPKFRGLFGRDSLIVAWQLLKYDSSIAKRTLLVLSKLQGEKEDIKTGEEPGKILHEYYPKDTPDKWWKEHKGYIKWLQRGRPVYMSIDSTPLFLIVFEKYLNYTKDFTLARKLFSCIEKSANWMIEYNTKGFFLKYERKTSEGLFHQSWKDSTLEQLKIEPPVAITEAQGYKYLALKSTAKTIKRFGKKERAKELLKEAAGLKKVFNRSFWLEKEKYFTMALDKNGKPKGRFSSNPGHLLFTGIIEKNKINFVVSRLFKKDMWTPYGIRTYSVKEPGFDVLSYHMGTVWPHDNWIIAQGFKELGYKKEEQKIKEALFRAFNELGYLPELYGVDKLNRIVKYPGACYPQAWASGALLNFLISG